MLVQQEKICYPSGKSIGSWQTGFGAVNHLDGTICLCTEVQQESHPTARQKALPPAAAQGPAEGLQSPGRAGLAPLAAADTLPSPAKVAGGSGSCEFRARQGLCHVLTRTSVPWMWAVPLPAAQKAADRSEEKRRSQKHLNNPIAAGACSSPTPRRHVEDVRNPTAELAGCRPSLAAM